MSKLLLGWCVNKQFKCQLPIVEKILKSYRIATINVRSFHVTSRNRNVNICLAQTVERGSSVLTRLTWRQQIRLLNINTDIKNNVFLFKHENLAKSNRFSFIMGIAQMFLWVGLSYMQYNFFYDTVLKEKLDWLNCFTIKGLPFWTSVLMLFAGPAIFSFICIKLKHTVKYIILHKGGNEATFITYHPFKKERHLTVPIKMISTKTQRTEKYSYMPIKIKGHFWHFLIDKKGTFLNPDLFDCTIGQKRSFN